MTKRYHISYTFSKSFSLRDAIIDIHPLVWRSQQLDTILIAWNEIPVEIEKQIAELEKERDQLRNERIDRRLENLIPSRK
jgi:hypothetical protein